MSGILNLLLGSAAGVIKDAYFNLVTLLLNTTSTNGAQNNTFLDSSTNNFSITRNGNTTQGTFTPFSQTGWSNYFDGSSYLTAPNAAWMNLGTSDFTMECWVYFNAVSATQMFVSNSYNAGTGGGGWAFLYRQDNTTLKFTCNSNVSYEKTWSPTSNKWYHVAVSRSGSSLKMFVDGTQIGTTSTSTDNISGASSTLVVGNNLGGTPLPITGYLSNLRINNTALYTSNFTVSTTPLTAVSGTQILTCQSNRFIDNSSNAATLTTSGTPSVQAFSPFAPTTFYETAVVGGSYYGDGSGDYLVNNSNSLQVASSTNFTLECWLYRQSTFTGDQGTCFFAIGSESANRMQFTMYGSAIRIEVYAGTLDFNGGFVPLNAWTHVAIVRTGGSTLSIYVNGVFATSASWSNVIGNTGGFIIGANRSVSNYVNGYISGLRLVNGTALYTSNFTPATAPPTAITNTTFLLNSTNAGIYDSTAKNDLETVGNAQVSTTQAKWGTTSMYFGTSGTNKLYTTSIIPQQSGNFTLEMWLYPTSFADYNTIFDSRTSDGDANGFVLGLNSAAKLYFYTNSAFALTTTGTISANTWTHVALVRNGTGSGNIKIYVNGTADATTATNTASFTRTSASIGDDWGTRSNLQYFGYADDIRISNFARYTATFTPPAAAFPIQ